MQNKKEIPANKNGKYQIKEESQGFYHLRVVEEIPTASRNDIPATAQRIIIFSVRDFAEYQKFKKMFRFHEEEIIHDPTFKPHEAVVEQPVIVEQPAEQEIPQPVVETKEVLKPKAHASQRGRRKKRN